MKLNLTQTQLAAYSDIILANARLNSNTTAITTAAQWDWKRNALTVPL